MAKTKVTQIRPVIDSGVAEEFKNYCQTNGIVMNFAATQAITLWLLQQKQLNKVAS